MSISVYLSFHFHFQTLRAWTPHRSVIGYCNPGGGEREGGRGGEGREGRGEGGRGGEGRGGEGREGRGGREEDINT